MIRRRMGMFAIGTFSALAVVLAEAGEYSDDPEILATLARLGDRSSAVLPAVNVQCGDLTMFGFAKRGPGQRDYCNKMAYAPSRKTALYAGGNHRVPHRMNDVWEYHLGSNTWHMLYQPDGGNPGQHKSAYFLTSRTLVREPGKKLDEKQTAQIEAYRKWWAENVVLGDGHLTTKRGGPIMPSHTWDAFCWDDRAKKLIWGMGASPAAQISTHAYYTGKPVAELQKQLDGNYSPMWTFDPATRRWSHYRTTSDRAKLRGMGATMCWLPDLGKSVWYVSAQNVAPAAYEMWLFDAAGDRWTELKPNGGEPISNLSTKEKVAPMSEQQTAYSAKHRKLVAVLKHDTFIYDVSANRWSKATTDERIYGHDARSVFAYDAAADVFLLAFSPHGKGKRLSFAAFSLDTGKWELFEPAGPELPETKFGHYMGYYDLQHNVMVIQGRYADRMWVYRHRRN